MGLDMYAYKAKKITKKEEKLLNGVNTNQRPDEVKGVTLFPVGSEDEHLIGQLMPYITKVNVKQEYVNLEKVRKDNAIPEKAHIYWTTYASDGSIIYRFKWGKKDDHEKEVTLSPEDLETKYTIIKDEESYAVWLKEVGYWRKAYDLQSMIYQKCPIEIENCGYYAVNDEMLAAMKRNGLAHGIKKEALFYCEWY